MPQTCKAYALRRWGKLETTMTDKSDVSINNPEAKIKSLAHEVAYGEETGEAFNTTLQRLIEAGEEVKSGPIHIMHAMQDVYGEELEDFPEPDTDDKDSNLPQGKVNVPYQRK